MNTFIYIQISQEKSRPHMSFYITHMTYMSNVNTINVVQKTHTIIILK